MRADGGGGQPAVVSWAPTRTDVFVRGTTNNVYHKWQINGRGTTWYPGVTEYEHLGGTIYGDLAAVSWSAHRIDLFGLGLDNACWHQWWNDLFARGMDNTIYHNSWKGKEWSGWYSIGGTAVGSPKVVSWGQQRLDVFIRGPDNAVYHKGWHGSHWRPSPFGWYNLGGVALDDIQAVSSRPRRLDIFTRNAENEVSHRAWEGSSWGDWESLGGSLCRGQTLWLGTAST
ncbi:hypothetical protein ACCO45_007331 [Purpureocillium lilacinum]|uniref:Uncharacterized protein n=1 Tax=Purpureocillium lilacinum TaxID=33203 RepID=A0ACC4DTG3_PURLI